MSEDRWLWVWIWQPVWCCHWRCQKTKTKKMCWILELSHSEVVSDSGNPGFGSVGSVCWICPKSKGRSWGKWMLGLKWNLSVYESMNIRINRPHLLQCNKLKWFSWVWALESYCCLIGYYNVAKCSSFQLLIYISITDSYKHVILDKISFFFESVYYKTVNQSESFKHDELLKLMI